MLPRAAATRGAGRPQSGTAIPSEQRAQGGRQGLPAGPDQEMRVSRQEGPGYNAPGVRSGQGRDPGDEVHPVPFVPEDGAPLDPPHHDLVEDAGRIQAGAAGHGRQRTGGGPRKQDIAATAAT